MTEEEKFKDLLEPYRNELRRGLIILAVLSQLDEAQYGYSLIKQLGEKGFEVDQGTLYPLLRRLEERGLLESTGLSMIPAPASTTASMKPGKPSWLN